MTEPPTDFDPALLQQLGRVVVHWSYVERLVSDLFVWAVEGQAEPLTVVTANISTGTLSEWIRNVLDTREDYSDQANDIRDLLTDISEVRTERNTLVHGVWALSTVPPSAIVQVIRLDRSALVSELVVTPADLDALSHHICDLAIKLREILLKLGVTA
jgi:hypothetical protein